jgi:uncharacterized membrane protein YqhA
MTEESHVPSPPAPGVCKDRLDRVGLVVLALPGTALLCLLAVLILSAFGVVLHAVFDLQNLFSVLFSSKESPDDWSLAVFALVEKFSIVIVLFTIIVGGWHNYIRPFPEGAGWGVLRVPSWLHHTGPYYLKAAICYSLAGVSAVGLLVSFFKHSPPLVVVLEIAIHFTFMFSGWIHQRESKKETC